MTDGAEGMRANHTTTIARLSSFALEDVPTDTSIGAALPPPVPVSEALHVLTSMEEVRRATESVAGSAQRLLSIFTPDLEPDLYDHPGFLEVVKRFVLGRSFAKVRVVVRDHARLNGGNNRFVAMARRLTTCLEIRIRAPQYRELTAAYCIADDRAIVYRLRADRWDGIVGFNTPPVARQYLQEFDMVWQASADEHYAQVAQL
jgi:hypothetical protein